MTLVAVMRNIMFFRALQGYLWVTGTPFSLEYPSLRGGFGWHDISWKHHFQV